VLLSELIEAKLRVTVSESEHKITDIRSLASRSGREDRISLSEHVSIGANPCTTFWGSTEMVKPIWLKSKAQKADGVWVLVEGMFPCPRGNGLGSAVSSPCVVHGESMATRQFRTLHKLTKPVLVSILLILNLFQ